MHIELVQAIIIGCTYKIAPAPLKPLGSSSEFCKCMRRSTYTYHTFPIVSNIFDHQPSKMSLCTQIEPVCTHIRWSTLRHQTREVTRALLNHKNIKQSAFVHVDLENTTMGCPNQMQETRIESECALG